MNENRRRWVERGKNLLIVALFLSAFYLLLRTNLTASASTGGLFSAVSALLPGGQEEPVAPEQRRGGVAHPVRLAISNARLGRYGVQYDQETVDARFGGALLNLFSDALSGAGAPQKVAETAYQAALSSAEHPVVYLDLLGAIPGAQLPIWLGGRGANPALTGQVRRLFLTSDRAGAAVLYYIDESDGSDYASTAPSDLSPRLSEAAAGFEPNGARFAFEDPAQYAGLAPYTLILPEPPRPTAYSGGNPVPLGSAQQSRLIEDLSFHPQSNVVYLPDLVLREGDTLRISPAGLVSYYSASAEDPRYPVGEGGAAPDGAQLADAAWDLLERSLSPRMGAARLYQAAAIEEEGGTALYYYYQLDGATVLVGAGGYAARIFFQEGRIAAFTLQLRTYEDGGTTSVVLPELQAAAGMVALNVGGGDLMLCYLDQGTERVEAGWIAK